MNIFYDLRTKKLIMIIEFEMKTHVKRHAPWTQHTIRRHEKLSTPIA